MTRWLQAARQASSLSDKTDNTDKTPAAQTAAGAEMPVSSPERPAPDLVLSDLSVLAGAGKARTFGNPSRASRIPSEPPTCAFCGKADWRVSMTEPDGRKAHVSCVPAFAKPTVAAREKGGAA